MDGTKRSRMPVVVPAPDRVRRITGSFGWIEHRLRRDGHLMRMTHADIALYLFLVLAGDENGVSYYGKEKVCDQLALPSEGFTQARVRLVERDLIAFAPFRDGGVNGYYQVLPLPERPRA